MISAAVFLLFLLFATPATGLAEDASAYREFLTRAEEHAQETEEALRTAAELAGNQHPFLHMRLAKLYVREERPAQAVAQAEKAVALSPSTKRFRYELAKLYLAGKQYNKAEDQLCILLKLDPGFASGYSSLAELYLGTDRHDLARLCLQRARLLGYRGNDPGLEEPPAAKVMEVPGPDGRSLFRFLKVDSTEKAEAILQEIGRGRLFEEFEREKASETAGEAEYGMMQSSELPDQLAEILAQMPPYSPPVIIRTRSDVRIMQRILPFNPAALLRIAEQSLRPEQDAQNQRAETGPDPAPAKKPSTAAPERAEGTIKAREGRQAPAAIAAMNTLENWKKAWENGDFHGYLAAYSQSFAPPDGSTFSAWKDKRQKSLARPKSIRIKISDTVIETLPNNQLLITFTQHYESEDYRDAVVKSLSLVEEAGAWKIVGEWIVRELPR